MIVDNEDQEFISGLFPQSLESLTLSLYDIPLDEHSLPQNLKSLCLTTLNATVDIRHLPRSLEHNRYNS
ncbi:hypothetical protein PPL_11194 [Heterostelium album PN500]|uniref:Uncharacterized protein n=1 Tax=Heterostelium pallidum (strain ATCC 26659 / Pp 5 / PN500) TaxID=670386 RepID=D3BTT4_HETP5|nr:hypothetical protein PPL_11194 [Heterostelium album PN500]EFA75120.1 hypothetical protein PPL_11194 [Heterostelium album PN500]|eukprot:XP_020427254.1 hypothetical protein PPL_11194 [Heterostelium album PN500]